MFKRLLFTGLFFALFVQISSAQSVDFCTAINKIVADAPVKFQNTRGEQLSVSEEGITWASTVAIPGVIKARFVSAMGLFYEGAVFQTKDIKEIPAVYERYKKQLNDCLANSGYKVSTVENFSQGLGAYPKLVFMKADEDAELPPAHLALEVSYFKPAQLYTVVMYIYEH